MNEENNDQLSRIKKIFTPFTIINIILFLTVILSSIYFFYYKKDFYFVMEEPCDLNQEECFIRDCSNPDNCPPNGLSEFKRYYISAKDFKHCYKEDCLSACQNKQIKCRAIKCIPSEEMGERCLGSKQQIDLNIKQVLSK